MNVLAIDAAQNFYSVAASVDEKFFCYEFFDKNTISKNLLLNIKSVLDAQFITMDAFDCFLTNTGPGSFTGIRVAISALQAFELIYNKPLYGINILKAVAIFNKDKVCNHKEVMIAIKSDSYNSYIQNFNSKIEPISQIARVKNDTITKSTNKENVAIFTNNKEIMHDYLIQANAKTILTSFFYDLSQGNAASPALPIYIH